MYAERLTKDHLTHLYDSETGRPLQVLRVVNVTSEVNKLNTKLAERERVRLLYARAKRGPIVIFHESRDDNQDGGSRIHFFVDELDQNVRPEDDTFGRRATEYGIGRDALKKLVMDNLPTFTAVQLTKYGIYHRDRAGAWHYLPINAGTISNAIKDVLTDTRPVPATFWFNETPAPIYEDDTASSLYQRWAEWRAAFQTNAETFLQKMLANGEVRNYY